MNKAHKHAAMIKAKADNMDLVVFIKVGNSEWRGTSEIPTCEGFKYFLCLPQHKEAVINSLNGGKSEVNYLDTWSPCNCNEPVEWSASWWYMDNNCKSRIKPRKEKRWICITDNLEIEDGTLYESYSDAAENSPRYKQIVEIEVEVP